MNDKQEGDKMKVNVSKDIVTIEMTLKEALRLATALHNEVEQLLTDYEKFGEMGSWDDLAIMGQVRDRLYRHLRPSLKDDG